MHAYPLLVHAYPLLVELDYTVVIMKTPLPPPCSVHSSCPVLCCVSGRSLLSAVAVCGTDSSGRQMQVSACAVNAMIAPKVPKQESCPQPLPQKKTKRGKVSMCAVNAGFPE